MAVTDDALPVPFDHGGKFLIRLKPLPAQLRFPVLEEFLGGGGIGIIPQLSERFLEKIGFVQALVGLQKQF